MRSRPSTIPALALVLACGADRAIAQTSLSGDVIRIARAAGPIVVDGDLSDEGRHDATRVDKWYEVKPGDNVEPKVRNVGYLAYDDRFFYAAFEFDDPNPSAIRAPYGDRDNVGDGNDDYGGVILDTRNSGRTAAMFIATARNTQYDAITDDQSGEDSSPDFFWESATRITPHGWTLEMRIPFSSLRYKAVDPQTWGILLYRNYVRDFHYQFFSTKLPRGGNCFICRSNTLIGLEHLPVGAHLVAAPYLNATELAHPAGDLGTPLVVDPVKAHAGLDLKFTPNPDNAIDVAVNPDFSQVESDTAQISANERFALLFPEKRPFFLEGVNLFSTPIQAVYTRTITSPRAGARLTGKDGGVTYTALFADDAGGGSTVIPGPNDSAIVDQDFASRVFVARARREIGQSFVSALVTDRETDGNGHNRVAGPDFQWRAAASDVVAGQYLVSSTLTPNRPDVTASWTGQTLASHAAVVTWDHNTTHFDSGVFYKNIGGGFRADTGFVPQVGYREEYGDTGWTVHPTGLVSRLRMFVNADRQVDQAGALISRDLQPGFGMDTALSGFMQFRYIDDRVRSGDGIFRRRQFGYNVQISPSRRIGQIAVNGTVGEDVDFDNSRQGAGATVNVTARLNATDHLELTFLDDERRLRVDDAVGIARRLFTARVSRVRGVYTFTSRMFVRVIAQYVSEDRDPSLYVASVAANTGTLTGSALFAYKLNWQSVLFVGFGDNRELSDRDRLEKSDRQVFVKMSYAFQR